MPIVSFFQNIHILNFNSFDIFVFSLYLSLVFFVLFFLFIKKNTSQKLIFACFIFFLFIIQLFLFFSNISVWSKFNVDFAIYSCLGLYSSTTICLFVENKFIKYEVQNNLILTSLKLLLAMLIFGVYFGVTQILNFFSILQFARFFVGGILATILLPFLFKILNKHFYTFSKTVDKKNVQFSAISLSPKHTSILAKKLSKFINLGDIVVLQGDLGAGKSQLVRAYLVSCGVKGKITSPTFTIVNEHFSASGEHFYHFDLYRIEDEDEVKNLDYEEILDDKSSTKFIEWAYNATNYLPKHYKRITIVKLGKNTRNIILENI